MARYTDFTPDTRKRIIHAIRGGNTYKVSAALGGVCYDSLRKWMRRGESKKPEDADYVAFLAAIKRAEAESQSRALGIIRRAGEKHWTAEAWYLERSNPEDWGDQKKQFAEMKKQQAALEKMVHELLTKVGQINPQGQQAVPPNAQPGPGPEGRDQAG